MIVGAAKETFPNERRVALVPAVIPTLTKAGLAVVIETNAGLAAGFTDAQFQEKGAEIVASRAEVFEKADIVLQVRALGQNPEAGKADLGLMKPAQVIVGLADPLGSPAEAQALAQKGVTAFAMELVPRITRAQSMDVLSSQATVAGYRAVLLAAATLPRMFPMFMTAAGTISPARVFVIGAGVAGLQAIATAKRLGAKVEAYDVRPAVAEQIESLGGKFVRFELETAQAEDQGGYAREQSEEFLHKQREAMGKVVAGNDVVISTAAVPGKKAPVLVTEAMVRNMDPGSVIVDLAAATGGNCELTRADECVVADGVTILGPTNLPSEAPYHASQMYAKNVVTFLMSIVKEGKLVFPMDDEVVRDTMVARGGEVVNPRVREALGLAPLAAPAPTAPTATTEKKGEA
ncbi:MAG: Re/Si-specific NAD(P)(+) transhydrogenase subunit alpha [Planctomycetes bacterium]|nr:Re/Si-specific NAD(P)(+) transhydrogenase subunit alpha [Planctomycetota bacterium]